MKVINLLFGLNSTCGFMLDSEGMTDIQSSFDDLIQEPLERDGCMVIYKGINLVLQAGEKYFLAERLQATDPLRSMFLTNSQSVAVLNIEN
jgi:hypothetical protein